jgi:hypothetical protein
MLLQLRSPSVASKEPNSMFDAAYPVSISFESIGLFGLKQTEELLPYQLFKSNELPQFWSMAFDKNIDAPDPSSTRQHVQLHDKMSLAGYLVDNVSVTAGTRRALQKFYALEPLSDQDVLNIFPPDRRAAVIEEHGTPTVQ